MYNGVHPLNMINLCTNMASIHESFLEISFLQANRFKHTYIYTHIWSLTCTYLSAELQRSLLPTARNKKGIPDSLIWQQRDIPLINH